MTPRHAKEASAGARHIGKLNRRWTVEGSRDDRSSAAQTKGQIRCFVRNAGKRRHQAAAMRHPAVSRSGFEYSWQKG